MGTLLDALYDLPLAIKAVVDVSLNMRLRVNDGRPVGWPVYLIISIQQQLQAIHVGRHVAVWWRYDAGRPAHHMVTGE